MTALTLNSPFLPTEISQKINWLPVFIKFLGLIKVSSKEMTEPGPIVPYEAQLRFIGELCKALEADQHHIVVLKARQLGISTIVWALDIFWLWVHPGLQGALIFDTGDNRDIARQTITEMMESLPPGYRIPVKKHNRTELVLQNGSRLQYMAAGKKKSGSGLGRSRALNFVHACVPGDTPVVKKDGRVVPIKEIRVGDEVLTHTGAPARVVDAWSNENDKGDLFEITPWLGQPLRFTGDHHIPTQRGIVDARDIQPDDWLVMPVRKITHEVTHTRLPETPKRPQGAGSTSAASGQQIELNEEFGFACGYYLAEGSIIRQDVSGRAGGVSFARHRTETAYGDRVVRALEGLYRSHRRLDRPNTLTSIEMFYGASLGAWFAATFGTLQDKFIPDEVFTWGEPFCRGLLSGLLSGDGSKTASFSPNRERKHLPARISALGKRMGRPRTGTSEPGKKYPINKVSLTTTRASIAMQARDLGASLGVGWAALAFKKGGRLHGRNCKDAWILTWCSEAGATARRMMGLEAFPISDRSWSRRYKIEDGRVLIKIRKIRSGIKCDRIYDITVDHEDHTFRTPYFAIGNSECSGWGDQKGLDSLIRALAEENPHRLYIFESTALGFNLFYDMCETAKQSPSQRFCFIGWWAKEVYRIKEGTEEFARWWGLSPQMTADEAKKSAVVLARYGHQITSEQIAWYRKQAFKQSAGSLAEELPWDESEAFVATGSSYFSLTRVTEDLRQISDLNVTFDGYAYTLGKKFVETRLDRVASAAEAELKIWEPPRKNGRYAIGVDGAFGRSADADSSCVTVWRCYADKLVQVAEYATPKPEAYQTAWILAHLAGSYRDCVINAELNGPGELIMRELQTIRQQILLDPESRKAASQLKITDALDNARWFLRYRADQVGPGKYLYNTKTTQDVKAALYGRLRDNYGTESVIVRSVSLLDEMRTLVQNGLKIEASGRNKDDRVFAAALATAAWTDWVRIDMLTNNQTFMRERAREQQSEAALAQGDHVMHGFVNRYFTKKQEERQQAYLQRLIDGF